MATRPRLNPVLARALGPLPFAARFVGVALVGTHLPFLALLVYGDPPPAGGAQGPPLDVMAIALIATITATVLTLVAIRGLLEPVHATKDALRSYLDRGASWCPCRSGSGTPGAR